MAEQRDGYSPSIGAAHLSTRRGPFWFVRIFHRARPPLEGCVDLTKILRIVFDPKFHPSNWWPV